MPAPGSDGGQRRSSWSRAGCRPGSDALPGQRLDLEQRAGTVELEQLALEEAVVQPARAVGTAQRAGGRVVDDRARVEAALATPTAWRLMRPPGVMSVWPSVTSATLTVVPVAGAIVRRAV